MVAQEDDFKAGFFDQGAEGFFGEKRQMLGVGVLRPAGVEDGAQVAVEIGHVDQGVSAGGEYAVDFLEHCERVG